MTETVTLPAIKRIEGHGRVALHLDDDGRVADAHFDVIEFRGFEKMLEGRMVWEMPLITSRICGVCPVSHHLAAVKAVDALYGVEIPRAALLLRELMHLGGFAQDHALHFFFLAGPDFLTGGGASRDLLGVIEARPDLARRAIALRRAGQNVVEVVGGRKSHPVAAIPGGMSRGIDRSQRDELLAAAKGMFDDARSAADLAVETTARLMSENPGYASTPRYNMAQMRGDEFAIYDGTIRIVSPDGSGFAEFDAAAYADHLTERTLDGSYANSPYLTAEGPDKGGYRVGPLARVNMAETMGGTHADELLAGFRERYGRPVHSVLAFHHARMIELVASVERMIAVLEDDEIVSDAVRVRVDRGIEGRGVAAVEAPRGTLIHDYEVDMVGRVTRANLVVATTHNVGSLDAAVLEAVQGFAKEDALTDESVLRMELGIRAHDPCLSCATHEIGRMPLVVSVHNPDGTLVAERGVS
ncbi:MAG: Ni/Fe hydrogenase subunit alpha [Coriobacteriia bacterium]|nr:Ni/Fe hydrogenase subunit alpha [Coriobacteriia bacterium]